MKRSVKTTRFVWGLVLGLVLVVGAWLALLAGQIGREVPSTQWVEQAYAHKLAVADAIRQPKLVVVAGSASMFGVDSGALEQAFGRPVVNLGVNAGILPPYIQQYARQAIKPGDWVLMPVEYPMYHERYSINQSFIDYWWTHPGFRRLDVNVPQLAQVLWLTSVYRALAGYRGLPQGFAVSGLYGPQNLDQRGDQVNSQAAQQQVWMRELVERSSVQDYGANARTWNANWAGWKALADQVTAAGGCAVFVPPPMLDREAYHRGEELRYYQSLPDVARQQGLNYIGSPLQTMYPMDRFFDTNYHLNAESRAIYTRQLLEWTRPAFDACRSSTPTRPTE
ncbi:hypothetical protein SAMN05216593_11957 [Pseudomonas asturiensis]|uniref:SGNH hydrolase-type esterase domain-containing protein n=1 Tax=Pseudomonas asturiensis TaxID=1190415 RepID=A0A1M7Q7E4_9PSED|nr:hypothetical protein SAMN05216593_11957 [Pseudomonas asturiensis]